MSDSMDFDARRLERLLGRPELAWLLDALRRRLERGGGGRLRASGVTPDQRAAAERLLGRPPGRGTSFSLSLDELERVLRRAGAAPDLHTAVERLTGPLGNRPAERAAALARWNAVFEEARPWTEDLALGAWLDSLRDEGLLKRLAGGDPAVAEGLLGDARRVIEKLPARGLSLSTLAAGAVGDAHALDSGRPLGALVRRAARHLAGVHEEGPEEGRALWASVGVLVGGAVTNTVLALNLPAEGAGATAQVLRLLGARGEPAWISLRQLLRDGPGWNAAGHRVWVCENPAVLAEAAEALGARCPPLVCTNGRPVAAVTTLLRGLQAAGAHLCYHGDFDWAGIGIANHLIQDLGARPWRLGVEDYRRAAAARGGRPLEGARVEAGWDPGLSPAMEETGRTVHEEAVLADLLADLAGHRYGGDGSS